MSCPPSRLALLLRQVGAGSTAQPGAEEDGMKYKIAVDVRKLYHIEVEAASLHEATLTVEGMQSTEIADSGELQDVETEVIEVVEAGK